MCSSDNKEHIQLTLAAVFATDLYSASVEDLATVLCFFELHDTGLRPR